MYAKTQNPFEEIALKFLSLQDKEPLQTFIMEKLDSLKPQVGTCFFFVFFGGGFLMVAFFLTGVDFVGKFLKSFPACAFFFFFNTL